MHVRLVSGEGGNRLKDKLDNLVERQTNPIKHVNNWVKGEMLSLEALITAINLKDSIDSRKKEAQREVVSI